jgi:hypothetical protein
MISLDLELTAVRRRCRIRQQRQVDRLATASPSLPGEPVSLLKLLVEKGKATDHGAALVPWAGSTFAHHNQAGPMEETSMS